MILNRFQTLASLLLEQGLRWSAFRFADAFRHHSGLIRLQMKMYPWEDRPLRMWLKRDVPSDPVKYFEWRKKNAPKFFFETETVGGTARTVFPHLPHPPMDEANRILNGEIRFFSHEYQMTGFPPDWHKDPCTGVTLNAKAHWSQIADDGAAGMENTRDTQPWTDIKFVWEANRFSMVYPLVRAYAASRDEKYPQAFWTLIQHWAEHNPPNAGANWKDGQEIALRLMAWVFGFYAFIHSPSTTPHHVSQFSQLVAAQAERISKNIGYAISTRSNHTISEAFGLWMVGLLFPELRHAEKYFTLGKKLLEEEAVKQIFPDGSYAMYSLNYHRFVLHLYLYAIQLGKLNQGHASEFPTGRAPSSGVFSHELNRSIATSIAFLAQLVDPSTGHMPVYGSNDGALVLPLNNCDFTDYRPLLQLGSVITTAKRIFEAGEWDEDLLWLCGSSGNVEILEKEEKPVKSSFPDGGVYLLRGGNSRAVLRCTAFRSRPSHADQLHLDLWIRGLNIACDSGTYLYSGAGIWRNGLARTSVHNTVTVDGRDQMQMVSRFTWSNWAKGRVLNHTDAFWFGEHDGYHPAHHTRMVLALEGDRWLVVDDLAADSPHRYRLHWLLSDAPYTENKNSIFLRYPIGSFQVQTGLEAGGGRFSILRADSDSTYGWRSSFYGHKEPAISLLFEAQNSKACFWTFFGDEEDQVEMTERSFHFNHQQIDLPHL